MLLFKKYIYFVCAHAGACVRALMCKFMCYRVSICVCGICRAERTIWESWFSPSTAWVSVSDRLSAWQPLPAEPSWQSKCFCFKIYTLLGMVVHTFNPSTQEAEAGRFLSSWPAWSTEWVPRQPGLYRETLLEKPIIIINNINNNRKERQHLKYNNKVLPLITYYTHTEIQLFNLLVS